MEKVKSKIRFSSILITFFYLTPFVPTSFQIFEHSIYQFYILWKILVLFIVGFRLVMSRKSNIDSLQTSIVLFLATMALSTFIRSGSIQKYFGFVFDSIGVIIIIKHLSARYRSDFFSCVRYFVRVVIYVNFILLLLKPEGIYVGYSMSMAVRYTLLGMDNQSTAILVPFISILTAFNVKEYKKITFLFIVDLAVSLSTLVLLWSATALVGIAIIIAIVLAKVVMNFQVSFKKGTIFIIFSFIGIVFFNIFKLFSFIIINVLGKGLGLSGRIELWESAIKTWLQHPLLGYGIQNTESLVYFTIMGDYRHAHCQYLQILINGGIILLLCFLNILSKIQRRIDTKENDLTLYIMIAGIIGYLFMCIADSYSHMVGFYYIVGIAYYYKEYLQLSDEQDRETN